MSWQLCSKQDVISIHPTNESVLQDFWSDTVRSPDPPAYYAAQPGKSGSPSPTNFIAETNFQHPPGKQPIDYCGNGPANKWGTSQGIRLCSGELPAFDLVLQKFTKGHLNVCVSYTSGTLPDPDLGTITIDPIIRMTAAAMSLQ